MISRPSRRNLFLAISAASVVAVIITARVVLLPFVLGLVVAYVLTPAVLRVEKLKVPRWAAILLVYAIVLGSISGFVGLIVPRLSAEVKTLSTEWPKLKQDVREKWLPKVDEKVGGWMGRPASSATEETEEQKPPIRVQKRDDGSFDVLVSDDVRFREVDDGLWQLEAQQPSQSLSSATVLQQTFDRRSAT